jgi:hypothetical protein
MEKNLSEKKGQLPVPKTFRRNPNAHLPLALRGTKKRNDGKFVSFGHYPFGGIGVRNMINNQFLTEISKRRKFKGWQREARRYKKAA